MIIRLLANSTNTCMTFLKPTPISTPGIPNSWKKAHSHCKLDWMRIQTGPRQCTFKPVQFAFVRLHYCKLTSVKSFWSHNHCASIAWPIQFKPCNENGNSFKDCSILCHSVELTPDIHVAQYAHKSPGLVVHPFYRVESSCTHVSIDWFTCIDVYIQVQLTCILCDCRFESTLNRIKTTSWGGLEANQFESGSYRSIFGVNVMNSHWTGLNVHWVCSVNGPKVNGYLNGT